MREGDKAADGARADTKWFRHNEIHMLTVRSELAEHQKPELN